MIVEISISTNLMQLSTHKKIIYVLSIKLNAFIKNKELRVTYHTKLAKYLDTDSCTCIQMK